MIIIPIIVNLAAAGYSAAIIADSHQIQWFCLVLSGGLYLHHIATIIGGNK